MENYRTAKFGKRFLGFLIDIVCVSLFVQLLVMIFNNQIQNVFHLDALLEEYHVMGFNMGVFDASYHQIASVDSSVITAFQEASKDLVTEYNNNQFYLNAILYTVGFLIFQFIIPLILKDGRSIGKLITKTKVVKKDDSKIGIGTLLLRNMVGMCLIEYIISMKLMFLPLTLSGCLVLAGDSKRSLHDYIAGTKVVVEYSEEQIQQEKKDIENNKNNPYHKTYKGFEFVDVDVLEKKNNLNNNNNNVQNESKEQKNNEQVVDIVEENKEEQQDK